MAELETRQGIGVSPGTASGPVVQVSPPVRPPASEPAAEDQEAATAQVRAPRAIAIASSATSIAAQA